MLLTACSASPGATARPSSEPLHADDRPITITVPTWEDGAATAAEDRAQAAMEVFVDHQLDADSWHAALAPHLTANAAAAYLTVDPADVRPAKLLAPPALLEQRSTVYLARVAVDTDVGTYVVLLQRLADGDPWLVERIAPEGAE